MNFWKGKFLLLLIILVQGCNCNKNRKNVDLTGIEVEVNVKHLDRVLFQLGTDSLAAKFRVMNEKYNDFLAFYITEILGIGDYIRQPELTIQKLADFLKKPSTLEVRDSCEKVFGDFTPYRKEIELAFRYSKYYFPDKPVPEIVTLLTNFSYQAFTFDTLYLGIGLDMHLGESFNYEKKVGGIPKYLYGKFSPEYLVPNAVKALEGQYFPMGAKDNTLLAHMIRNGLQLYFADLLMPNAEDYRKIGYKPDDIEWCMRSEPAIWKFFIERELLYSTNMMQITQFITPGPFTSGMPPESPGNIGSWVGWRIVRAYADRYPDTPFEALLNIHPQDMLTKSGYKPRTALIE